MIVVRWVALASLMAAMTGPARSQEISAAHYPSKPIRVFVGFGAGGGTDVFARIVAQKLTENIGQPVIVENRPGAGGRIAVEYAQGQPADGYTLIVGAVGQLAIASAISPNLPFHPTKTLAPLTMIASYSPMIAGQANHTIKSIADLIAWAKANPHKSNYPTSSPAFTVPTELFKLKTGLPAQAVPYKSTNEAALSIATGQTLFGIGEPSSVLPLAHSGKIRVLAVSGGVRSTELPDVPTLIEAGFAHVDLRPQWNGAFAVAGTPPAIKSKLEMELRRFGGCRGTREDSSNQLRSRWRPRRRIRATNRCRDQDLF
jgi:tripartite-type tricarboxylate transporter receptor subunit TctC